MDNRNRQRAHTRRRGTRRRPQRPVYRPVSVRRRSRLRGLTWPLPSDPSRQAVTPAGLRGAYRLSRLAQSGSTTGRRSGAEGGQALGVIYPGRNDQRNAGKNAHRKNDAHQLHEEKENDGKAGDKSPEQNGEKGRRSRPLTLHWAGGTPAGGVSARMAGFPLPKCRLTRGMATYPENDGQQYRLYGLQVQAV
ncbi:hypothetical protein F4826_004677 [Rahnella inusitata]|nr:hypothetical protein [Rahnella inusitata]